MPTAFGSVRLRWLSQTAVAELFRCSGRSPFERQFALLKETNPVTKIVQLRSSSASTKSSREKLFAVAAAVWYDVDRSAGRRSSSVELLADGRNPRTNGWTEAALSSFQVVHPSSGAGHPGRSPLKEHILPRQQFPKGRYGLRFVTRP